MKTEGGGVMAGKQPLTNDNILSDIKNILRHPANLSHAEHRKSLIPINIFTVVLLAAMLIFQDYYKLILAISLVFIVAYLAIGYLRKRTSAEKVSLDGYEIKKEVVSYVNEEVYITDHSVSRIREKMSEMRVFIMYFESGKKWNIPKDNYAWSAECPMSDRMIYQTTSQGNLFWTVTNKDTGEIVVAYPAEYFEYKK